jgi:hypothetical protein
VAVEDFLAARLMGHDYTQSAAGVSARGVTVMSMDVQGKGGAATHTMSLLSRMAAIIDGRVPENPNTVSIERLDSTVDDATKAGGCGA